MDITMIGLQNAGKTSLLRVLAVSVCRFGTIPVQRRGISIDGIVLTDSIRAGSSPSSTFRVASCHPSLPPVFLFIDSSTAPHPAAATWPLPNG